MTMVLSRLAVLLVAALIAATGATPALAQAPYVLVDMDTGDVLGQRRSGELWYPASLTKLMTIYIAFQALGEGRLAMNSPVTISEHAAAQQPSRMGFRPGTVVTVDNALKMLIVKSANDVAVAVAEMLGGTEAAFVADMNREARRLGMIGTRFINPHGLPGAGQSTTARDLAVLARAIWTEFPQYRGLFQLTAIQYGSTIMPSANSLLEYYLGANGMKTGYICSSGFNIVGTATQGARTLLVVVLGENSLVERAVTAVALLDAGFALSPQAPRTPLAAYRPASAVVAPVDMRPTICPPGAAEGDELANLDALLTAALGPKIMIAEPVAVFTGGADMAATLRVDIPLPRPRPAPPVDALGVFVPIPAPAAPPLPRPRP